MVKFPLDYYCFVSVFVILSLNGQFYHIYQGMQGFLVYPFLPSYAQGCALREKGRVLAWPRSGHASTLLCSGDPLVGREQILRFPFASLRASAHSG